MGWVVLQSMLQAVQGGGGIVGGDVDQGEVVVDRCGVGAVLLQAQGAVRAARKRQP